MTASKYGRWTYGRGGDIYPVEPGDHWMVGDALFICGDITVLSYQWLRDLGYDLVYSDPPWNQGNMRSFRTKAALLDDMPFARFLDSFADLVSAVPEAYVETSTFDRDISQDAIGRHLESRGMYRVEQWIGTYYKRHPMLLSRWGHVGMSLPAFAGLDLSGYDDDDMPDAVLARYSGKTVFDPCTGQGLTARAAYRQGHRFIGTELHPRRMADALLRQAELTGETPRQVSEAW